MDSEENLQLLDDMEGLSSSKHNADISPPNSQRANRQLWKSIALALFVLLFFSVSANILQYWHSGHFEDRSPHAGVTGGFSRIFTVNTEWSSDNKTHVDMLWGNLSPDTGMVVVDNEYSKKMDLYQTEPFPWDNSKSIYLLESYHSLHCLMYIYRALREFEQGLPQTQPMHHHIHCLDALREKAICSADDTLRPAGTGAATPLTPGRQPRKKCRDWNQLERWAVQNSACFKSYPNGHPNHKTLEEWRNCPKGSPFIPIIKKYFNGS